MPYTFTAAPSSRISKPKAKKPSLTRSLSSSLFSAFPQRKPLHRSKTKPEAPTNDDLFEDRLDDLGLVACLATNLSLRDVVQYIKYINSHMFDEIPERSGMNSTRMSEVLNFRKSLPPIVTNAHVHALMKSPTSAEKEIKELTAKGVLRRVVVPGRGVGGSSISDALVVVEEWIDLVQHCSSLTVEQKERYVQHLKNKPLASSISRSSLLPLEATALMNTGFLTSSNAFINSANIFARPEDGSSGTLTSIASISKAASGSHAATGGQGATHSAGGGGAGGLQNRASSTTTSDESSNTITRSGGDLQLSLPSTGPFLKLLISARSHMISLLSKSKYSEAPETLLRERWNGGVVTDGRRSKSGGSVFAEILPGRTRKWKQFYGLRFDWVLAECVGAGLVEVFETGSVGRGVRAV